jgi:hypothetical protein
VADRAAEDDAWLTVGRPHRAGDTVDGRQLRGASPPGERLRHRRRPEDLARRTHLRCNRVRVEHDVGVEQREQRVEVTTRDAARNAATSCHWRPRSVSATGAAPCTLWRARLANCRVATVEHPAMAAISSYGTANMSLFRHTCAATVVNQPPRFSISPLSDLLSRSHASWTASSASLSDPSIR